MQPISIENCVGEICHPSRPCRTRALGSKLRNNCWDVESRQELEFIMSVTNSATKYEIAGRDLANMDAASELYLVGDMLSLPTLDLSAATLNRALRDVALEELTLVRARYDVHRDPVRCAVGISVVLRSLAKDLFGEKRIEQLRRGSWLRFLLRTSDQPPLRPDVLETMSAALYEDPPGMKLPEDCTFWFQAAEDWIDHQRDQRPLMTCAEPVESDI